MVIKWNIAWLCPTYDISFCCHCEPDHPWSLSAMTQQANYKLWLTNSWCFPIESASWNLTAIKQLWDTVIMCASCQAPDLQSCDHELLRQLQVWGLFMNLLFQCHYYFEKTLNKVSKWGLPIWYLIRYYVSGKVQINVGNWSSLSFFTIIKIDVEMQSMEPDQYTNIHICRIKSYIIMKDIWLISVNMHSSDLLCCISEVLKLVLPQSAEMINEFELSLPWIK